MGPTVISSGDAIGQSDLTAPKDMHWIPEGTLLMGSNDHYPEERHAHQVHVSGFWIDRSPVTNAQFEAFVKATGHVTFAEIAPRAGD